MSKEKKRKDVSEEVKKTDDKPKSRKEKKKRSVNSVFDNDKVLLALSFIAAFFIWAVVSVNNGETANYPLAEVPVTIDLSEDAKADNLSVVTIDGVPVDDFTVTVRVRGNSVTVGSLRPVDIQVYGTNLGNIVTSGSYPVTLLAKQVGVKNNYEIVSVTPSEVKIVVDRSTTVQLPIEPQISAVSPPEYYIGAASLSDQNVSISGPEQVVSKAVKAVVETDVDKELEETTTFQNLAVVLLDSNGEKIEDDSITVTPEEVDATIPVLVKKKVPIELDYTGVPNNFDAESFIKIEPSEIEIAASAATIDSVNSIALGTLDMSTVSYGMKAMSYSVVMPEGVRNLKNVDSVTVNFDFSSYSTKSFIPKSINAVNLPDGLDVEYNSYSSVIIRVIGPKTEIAELTPDNISVSVDFSDAKIGSAVMPIDVSINKEDSTCWIYGSYTLNVTVVDQDSVSSSGTDR